VANKIAAGEVVERPASVLKELIENALDAGASRVAAEVTAGGRKLVAVSDNGGGMSRDDALLAVERHATSKIRDVDDIERIATLGFRGEALAAIAAVSRFRLVTRREEDPAGTEILITGGRIRDVRECGAPHGTAVEVRDLFHNVPARRKFLRSAQTELSHLRAAFLVQALSHPAAGMSLKVDGRDAYHLPEGAGVEDRIRDLFGGEYLDGLRPLSHRAPDVTVSGYAGLPAISRADRGEQYVLVNGRVCWAPVLGHAVRESYRAVLPSDRHPIVFLFLEMPPERVDVNVHPTKKEVRFRRPAAVRDAVIAALTEALSAARSPERPAPRPDEPVGTRRAPVADAALRIENLPPARAFRYPRPPVESPVDPRPPSPPSSPLATDDRSPVTDHPSPRPSPLDPLASASPWSWCRVLGQIGDLYVVLETEDGLVLMDPHAAHERVLFERFMADVINGSVQSQSLLLPESVELGPRDAARVRANLELFKNMGFGIAEFGGDAFVVDAVPSHFRGAPAGPLLVEVAHSLEQAGARGERKWRQESIAQAACKAAVKARDTLRLEEIEALVVDLVQTDMPYTCPHGRPTLILTSFRELNRKFGRE